MANNIRFITIGTPIFLEAGLNLSERWQTVDVDTLTPEQRDVLEQQTGRIVGVHEDDAEKWAQASNGLELHEGKFRYPDDKTPERAMPIGKRHAFESERRAVMAKGTGPSTRTKAESDASAPIADRPLPDNLASGATETSDTKGRTKR